MLKIWILYNLIVTLIIFGTSLGAARALTNYLLPLLLLPLLYNLGKDLLRKPRRKKILDPVVFASDMSDQVTPTLTNQVEEGTPLDPMVSDDNRRLFLKLVGSTGLSVVIMAIFGKQSAQAAFFGSVPGPGTMAVKNIAGETIDPAEKQPTDGYTITEVDDLNTTAYYGFVHKTGAWYITKEDATGSYRYIKGLSSFSTSWTDRTNLAYDYFDNVF